MTDSESPRLAVLLAKLSKMVFRKAEEALPGMSVKDYMALTNLNDRGVPQQRLAESLHMDENNLVLLLNGLEAAGSIARRRDRDDRLRECRAEVDVIVGQSRQDRQAVVCHPRAVPVGVTLSAAQQAEELDRVRGWESIGISDHDHDRHWESGDFR